MDRLAESYRNILKKILPHRGLILAVAIATFGISLVLVIPLRKELIPEQDQSLFVVTIQAPVGTSIVATDIDFRAAEAYLSKLPEVQAIYTSVGNFQGQDTVNIGQIYVSLKNPKKRKLRQRELMEQTREELRKILPGDQVYAQDLSLAGFSASRG